MHIRRKVKIFEIIESRKLRGNVDATFGTKRFFSYIDISGNLDKVFYTR